MSHGKRNSGQPKQKWTLEEEQALRLGVKSYGVGKWRLIQKDDACGPVLANRSNVDLKDKWRNLNMEAREQACALMQSDDDPDFGREANTRKRKKQRNSISAVSGSQRPLQQRDDAPAEVTQDSDAEHAVTASASMEADSTRPGQHPWPPPTPLNCALPDSQGSLDISPDGKGGPIVDDMVVAAVISLQDPVGSGPDDICAWIEDHYPAIDKDSVKMVMNNMVQAGRLQHVPHHPSLVRMGGVVRQMEAEHAATQALAVGDADAIGQEDQGKLVNDQIVAEHAMLAAHAIADAEEAARKASSLLAAANTLEHLDRVTLTGS